jgi:ribose-phosphate pyrophosphokinase
MSADFVRRAELESSVQECMVRYRHPLKLFGLSSSNEYARQVAEHLGVELIPHYETTFEDGECYIKSCDGSMGNVRGHNAFVISSLYSDELDSVNDKFVKLAIFCG